MAYIYQNGAWATYEPKKYGVNTTTFTTYPFTIKSPTTPVNVTIYGNMQQTGTPTPTTPIQPQECGERTENLFDKNAVTLNAYVSNDTGEIKPLTGNLCASDYIDVSGIDTFYITLDITSSWGAFYDASKNYVSGFTTYGRATSVPNNAKYMRCTVYALAFDETMVNEGSTALPYEPYGYKIPISSNNTTINVYLGELQSTRKIKKLVIDGTGGTITDSGRYRITVSNKINIAPICTHYKGSNVTSYTELNDGEVTMGISSYLTIYDSNCTTLNEYQTYLQQQYAAGTPVTIWYVLATPETAVVNEPIRKIGDYADTVTTSIPVIINSDSVDINTTLKPSVVAAPSLSY